jgi:hypothetical protein
MPSSSTSSLINVCIYFASLTALCFHAKEAGLCTSALGLTDR